jgi:hypothetical protein
MMVNHALIKGMHEALKVIDLVAGVRTKAEINILISHSTQLLNTQLPKVFSF